MKKSTTYCSFLLLPCKCILEGLLMSIVILRKLSKFRRRELDLTRCNLFLLWREWYMWDMISEVRIELEQVR